MDRITGKDAKLMMEALASVYTKEEVEQEVISEEVAETELVLENEEYEKLDENLLQLFTRNRTVYRRDPKTGEKIKVDQQRDPNNLDKYVDKKTSGTGDYGYRDKKPGEAGDGTMGNFVRRTGPKSGSGTGTSTQAPPTAKERAYGPRSTLNADQQAVNREYDRLRKTDPKAAEVYGKKMAARGAAKSDFKIEKPTQAQSNPTAAQKQASVDAAIKSVNTPEKMNKQAPAGTALRAQQDKQAAAKAAANAPRRQAAPGARNAQRAPGGMASGRPAPKPAANTAVGSAAAKPAGGYQLPAGARPMTAPGRRPMARPGARNRGVYGEELDIFDTIKEYLIGEGATEEEALKQMLILTDEQRTEILEGSCGSKRKKKGGYKK